MDLSKLLDLHDITTALLIGGGGYIANRFRQMSAALNDTVKSAAILHEALNGHAEMDTIRFDMLNKRLDDLRADGVERH